MLTRLTREQAAIIGAYTGFMCGPFEDIHATIERVMGRPVWTHEMGDKTLMEEVRQRTKQDFLALCADPVLDVAAPAPKLEPLTDEEIKKMWKEYAPIIGGIFDFTRAVEAAHNAKLTESQKR